MIALLDQLTGDLGKRLAGLLIAAFAALGLYAKGRSDGKSNELRKADKAYRETREKMDAVATGDDDDAARDWLRERGQSKRDL